METAATTTTMMDAAYIAAVEKTLSDLTGERALGAQIASDVADCHKLDLLRELHEMIGDDDDDDDDCLGGEGGIIRALDILNQNASIWNDDARIALRGVTALRRMQNQSRDGFQSRLLDAAAHFNLKDQDGLQIVLENMQRHPLHADIQRDSAYILLHVIMEDRVPASVPMVTASAVDIASCLVNIMKNHDEKFEPQRAALSTLEQAAPVPNREGFPEIVAAIAPAGGIPVLFNTLTKLGIALERGSDQDEAANAQRFRAYNQLFRKIISILRAMLISGPESRRLLIQHFMISNDNAQEWTACFQAVCSNMRAAARNDVALLSNTTSTTRLMFLFLGEFTADFMFAMNNRERV